MTSIPIMHYGVFDFEYEKDKESASRNKDRPIVKLIRYLFPKK